MRWTAPAAASSDKMMSSIATSQQGAVHGASYHDRVGPCEERLLCLPSARFSRQVSLLSRPIPLARSPEFVVCPLMCEIQAFRYFWPVSSSIVARPGRPTKESTVDAANQNTREAMTLESIERDPWKAVDLPLPKDVDRTLLAAVALVADQCAKAGFAVARVAEIVEPEVAWRYRVREVEAGERRDEARRELGALPVEQVAKVSPFLHPDEMQHKAVVRLLNIEADRQRLPGNLPSPNYTTAEGLDKNPWHAVFSTLPENASVELLDRVGEIAVDLMRDALQRREASYTREESNVWDGYAAAAAEAWQDVRHEQALALDRQAPEFSAETIDRDPWTAVYLPIPDNADAGLLAYARNQIVEAVWGREGEGPPDQFRTPIHLPTHIGAEHSREENYAHASERITELEGRVEIAAEAVQTQDATAAPTPQYPKPG